MKPRKLIGVLLFAILISLAISSTGVWAKKGGNGDGKGGGGNDGGGDGGGSGAVCTGTENPTPTMTYVGPFKDQGNFYTQDIMLASTSGCDTYVLLSDAAQQLYDKRGFPGDLVSTVRNLRMDVRNGKGIVIWVDIALDPWPVLGMRFELDLSGRPINVTQPEPLYLPPDPQRVVSAADVRLNEEGQVELVVRERFAVYTSDAQVVTVNVDSVEDDWEVLPQPDCNLDPCFEVTGFVWWNQEGDGIYLGARNLANSEFGYARFRHLVTGWEPELVVSDDGVDFLGINSEEYLLLRRLIPIYNKGGKLVGRQPEIRMFDPELCVPNGCRFEDGPIFSYEQGWTGQNGWMPDGGLLVPQPGSEFDAELQKLDADSGEPGDFLLVIGGNRSTSFGWDTSFGLQD